MRRELVTDLYFHVLQIMSHNDHLAFILITGQETAGSSVGVFDDDCC
jgi:hypothetical protein